MGGCFNIDYTGQNITTANLSSTNNYKNGSKTTITISKSSSCKIYTEANIYLHTNNTTTAPIDTVQALRYKIVSEDNVEYDGYISRFCDVLMATVPIEDISKTYTVYIWIDNSKSYGEYDGKSYSGYVYATSIQTSTIEKDDIPENYLNTDCPGITNIGFSYIGKSQTFTAPKTGTYKIELWGAQGGSDNGSAGGKGAYVSGNINLESRKKIYIYIGENPTLYSGSCYTTNKNNSFNGTKLGSCAGGGGATDIRLINTTNWYDFTSLKSRIIVAAGGGGAAYSSTGFGGYGGALNGGDGIGTSPSYNSSYFTGSGATQKTFLFGQGMTNSTSLGGSGYYGGQVGYGGNAGGGSSFISGYPGCDAISESSTENNIIHTGQANHYSGYVFNNGVMIDGGSSMPTHDGEGTMIGNSGNGYAKITFIE